MLKTLGFTPAQVAGVIVAEHAAIGAAGIGAGLAAERLLTAALLDSGHGVVTAATPVPAPWALLIAGGTELAVMLATALPGWRASRVSPVAAATPSLPRGHLSRLARTALESRLPPSIVLGARGAFVRRLPAALTIGGLAIPMLMITIGLGFWSTLDDVQQHPADIGLAAALTVSPGALSTAQAGQLVDRDRDVAAVYPSVKLPALLPGETTTITTLGMGTSERPYPFHVAQGRLYRAPGEAVASQGLLGLAHLRVGGLRPDAHRRRPGDLPHRRPDHRARVRRPGAGLRPGHAGRGGRGRAAGVLQPGAAARRAAGRRPGRGCCVPQATGWTSRKPPARRLSSTWCGS